MSELSKTDFAVEFVRKPLKPTYIYQLPLDENKCYQFCFEEHLRPVKSFAYLRCSGCRGAAKKGNQNEYFNNERRKFEGCFMKEDPTLGHISGCEPLMFSLVMSNLDVIERSEQSAANTLGFPLIKAQRYVYSALHRLEEDTTKCYRFSRLMKTNIHIGVSCNVCKTHNSRQFRQLSTSSGFTEDPRIGHHPLCEPLCYKTIMEEYEIIDGKTADKHMLQKKDNTGRNGVIPNIDLAQIDVVEVRNKVTYLYRTPEDPTQCCRFFSNFSTRSNVLHCSCCYHMKKTSKEQKTLRTYQSDGFKMLENPSLNHFEECKPSDYNKEIEGYRLLDNNNDVSEIAEFPLVRRLRVGPRSLLFTLENDGSKCYHFHFDQRTGKTYCAKCDGIYRKNRQSLKSIKYRFTGTGFFDDPLFNHFPECESLLKSSQLKKYEIVDEESTQKFLKLLHASSEIMIRPEMFSHCFNIPMFSADEVKLRLDGRSIYVECNRSVSAHGLIGGTLVYSMKLPESVDISTIQSLWTGEQLKLSAKMNS